MTQDRLVDLARLSVKWKLARKKILMMSKRLLQRKFAIHVCV